MFSPDKITVITIRVIMITVMTIMVIIYGRLGLTTLHHLRKFARTQAQLMEEGADEAKSALTLHWGCCLSVALH